MDERAPSLTAKSTFLTRAERAAAAGATPEIVTADESRAVAEAISTAEIPLPPGLDTAAALDWPGQSSFGPLTTSDIRDLLEANAARDWIWHAAHHRLTDEQRQILREIPEWRRVRGNPLGDMVRDAVERILRGEDGEWACRFARKQYPEWDGSPPANAAW